MTRIVSTCGQDMVFKFFEKEAKGSKAAVSRIRKDAQGKPMEIKIGGGAGVLIQSGGMVKRYEMTAVPDEVVKLLHTNDGYMRMKARGFFTEYANETDEIKRARTGQPEDMERRDMCAQIDDHEHAQGLDDRISHAGTRAAAGPHDSDKGEQPLSALDGEYGAINI